MRALPPGLQPVVVSLVLAALVCAVVAGGVRLGLLSGVEFEGYDLLVWARGFEPALEQLVIVDFDESSQKALRVSRIPRRLLAEALDKITTGEAALVGLDLLLDEKRAREEDQQLAAALARAANVILVESFGSEQQEASEPLPEFAQHALGVAFANLPQDDDGFIRRFFLLMRTTDYQGLSLPLALASNHLGQQPVRGRPGTVSPGTVRLGELEIPLDDTEPYTTLVGFWSPAPGRVVSLVELLAPEFDPSLFKGKIVLIGQSSSKGKDFYPTPVFRFRKPQEGPPMLAGTYIHAAALATLLTGKTIRVLGPGPLWALNFLLLWLVIALVITVRPLYSIPAVVAGVLGTYLVAQFLFSTQHLWMKFISTEAGILLALPAGLGYRFLEERRLKAAAEAERREVMSLFERYVAPEVAAEIWKRRSEIVLAGEERTATVLFSDIRSFTALTAGRPSAEVLAWLNNYFTAMSEVIRQNGGYLNKFIGDGLMVLFGVPLSEDVEQDACRAVQTALEMLERVEQLNAELPPEQPRIQIGIGLHTGPLTAGNVGARDRLEYSVVGETVNLASRLEALTKEFKTGLVLSPQTRDLVQAQFETIPLAKATVRGFAGKIQVYTVNKRKASAGA